MCGQTIILYGATLCIQSEKISNKLRKFKDKGGGQV